MADVKISGLPASTTPLAGTEVLPIVQSGVTKKVAVSALTAGRDVSALSVTSTNDASLNTITAGLGGGAVATNTVFGNLAFVFNGTGARNAAFGAEALQFNTGNNNAGFGYRALFKNTAAANSGFGHQAALNTTTGTQVAAFGFNALVANTTGSEVSAFGYNALATNTTGGGCSAFGTSALQSNETANYNTAIGDLSLVLCNAANNTAVGYGSGYLTTGASNQFFGYLSGNGVTSGANNAILGSYTGAAAPVSATGSNWIVLSDGAGTIGAQYQTTAATDGWFQKNNSAAWSITSDARIKKNVASLESGLDVISALRPVEFDYIENDKHDIGFIAQEYQTVLPAQISEGKDGMLSLNQNLVPYLVKAIQELKAEIELLKQGK